MASLRKKIALTAIGSAIALSFVVFAVLLFRYDRGDDPNNEDEILARAMQAEADDNPPLAAQCWRKLVLLNPLNEEYVRRYYHSLVRLRDFKTLAEYTNNSPVKVELTEDERKFEQLIVHGIELEAVNSNDLAVACFIEATNLNYYAAVPYLIDGEVRRGAIGEALDDAREYIRKFPRPTMVLHTVEWYALADRPDLIDETRQMLAGADAGYDEILIDYYCAALSAWIKGDNTTLAATLHKIGYDTVKTPVARMMAVESAANGNDPKLLVEAFHALISSPPMFDFHERGRRAVKRFVAAHFPDKLPIRELGKLADLAISSSGGDDLELLRVSLLSKQADGTLHDFMISHAEHLYPDDNGIKAIRQEYERARAQKQQQMQQKKPQK